MPKINSGVPFSVSYTHPPTLMDICVRCQAPHPMLHLRLHASGQTENHSHPTPFPFSSPTVSRPDFKGVSCPRDPCCCFFFVRFALAVLNSLLATVNFLVLAMFRLHHSSDAFHFSTSRVVALQNGASGWVLPLGAGLIPGRPNFFIISFSFLVLSSNASFRKEWSGRSPLP